MINFFYPLLVLATSVGLSFGQVSPVVPLGEEFGLTINLATEGRQTLGTDAVIIFDPKVLSVTKVKAGKIYPFYPETLGDIDNVHGKVRFSGTVGIFQTPKLAEGVLGEVFFRAKKVGVTRISFAWEEGKTDDSNIVPAFGGVDLIIEKPKEVNLAVREASFEEKILILLRRVLPFI